MRQAMMPTVQASAKEKANKTVMARTSPSAEFPTFNVPHSCNDYFLCKARAWPRATCACAVHFSGQQSALNAVDQQPVQI